MDSDNEELMSFDNDIDVDDTDAGTKETLSSGKTEPRDSSSAQGKNQEETKDKTLKFALMIYAYVSELKIHGHQSIAEMLFKDTIKLNSSVRLLTDAIGRERFVRLIEEAYYSTGKILSYLEFISIAGIQADGHEIITQEALGLHRIYGASVRTVRSNKGDGSKKPGVKMAF